MTISYQAPDHLLTLEEWDALPIDESRRLELVEGVLLVSPRARISHQEAVATLVVALRAALPAHLRAVPEAEVVVDDGPTPTVRVPDVVVLPASAVDDRPRCTAAEVVAAFEVLSPGTVRTDRIMKTAEYAEAGIAVYGIVDVGPPLRLTELRLGDGGYERVAEHLGRARLGLGGGVEIDLGG